MKEIDLVRVRILLNSRFSNTLGAPQVIERLNGSIRIYKPRIPLEVTITNSERLDTAGYASLLIKIGD